MFYLYIINNRTIWKYPKWENFKIAKRALQYKNRIPDFKKKTLAVKFNNSIKYKITMGYVQNVCGLKHK